MLWGCFTMYGVGSLTRIKGKMNQYMQKEILDIKLRETIESMPIDKRNIVFRQKSQVHGKKRARMVKIATISSITETFEIPV